MDHGGIDYPEQIIQTNDVQAHRAIRDSPMPVPAPPGFESKLASSSSSAPAVELDLKRRSKQAPLRGQNARKKRAPKGTVRPQFIGLLQALISNGEWGLSINQMAKRLKVSRTRLYELSDQDRIIQQILEYYENKAIGRTPAAIRNY